MPGLVTAACDPSGGNKVMGYLISGMGFSSLAGGGEEGCYGPGPKKLTTRKRGGWDVGYVTDMAPCVGLIRKSRGRFAVSS